MKYLVLILVSFFILGCTNNSNLDTGISNTQISGEAVVYSQGTF